MLKSFEDYLSKIILPALKSLEAWGTMTVAKPVSTGEEEEEATNVKPPKSAQVEEFLEQVEKFIQNLLSAVNNMEGQVTLAENGIGHVVDTFASPADYQAAGKCVNLELHVKKYSFFLSNNKAVH